MKEAALVFHKNALLYHQKFADVSLYHQGLDEFCDQLKEDAAVLDIACGPGNIAHYLLDKKPKLQLLGFDLAPGMIEIASQVNPNALFEVMDSGNITHLSSKFDAVVCGFLLPYLTPGEAERLISDIVSVSMSNAVLYLSAMIENEDNQSGNRTSSTGDTLFLHYHAAEFIENLVLSNHYKIINRDILEYLSADGSKTSDLVLVAQLDQLSR
jgi:ubiquinone/menaquinone biosynthesis C-methylase UbiE